MLDCCTFVSSYIVLGKSLKSHTSYVNLPLIQAIISTMLMCHSCALSTNHKNSHEKQTYVPLPLLYWKVSRIFLVQIKSKHITTFAIHEWPAFQCLITNSLRSRLELWVKSGSGWKDGTMEASSIVGHWLFNLTQSDCYCYWISSCRKHVTNKPFCS